MADGKCKCGRPLENGEKLCPLCNSKKDATTKRIGGAAGIAFLCVAVGIFLIKGRSQEAPLTK